MQEWDLYSPIHGSGVNCHSILNCPPLLSGFRSEGVLFSSRALEAHISISWTFMPVFLSPIGPYTKEKKNSSLKCLKCKQSRGRVFLLFNWGFRFLPNILLYTFHCIFFRHNLNETHLLSCHVFANLKVSALRKNCACQERGPWQNVFIPLHCNQR